ncbi:MAG: ABC transporter substrate-binding protein [Chloroflexi bacterium]|nr:ABC transporter substrate-binding protein [Chloroflexota bacterium]
MVRKWITIAALALLVVGCARQAATPQKSLGTLQWGAAVFAIGYSPFYVAQAKGYFQDEGFDSVQLIEFQGGTPNQSALQGGQVDIAMGAFSGVVDAMTAGRAELAVATLTSRHTSNLVIRKDVAQQKGITEQSPLSNRIRAMKGLRIAVTSRGAGTDQITRYLLLSEGLDPDKDVDIIATGADTMVPALENGSVDVFTIDAPTTDIPLVKGEAIRLVTPSNGEFPPAQGMLYLSIFAMKDFIQNKPEVIQAAVNAVVRGAKFIKDNPIEAKAIVRQKFSTTDEAAFESGWAATVGALTSPEITKESVEKAFQFTKVAMGVDGKFSWDEVARGDFVLNAKAKIDWR